MSAKFKEYVTFIRIGKKDGDPSYVGFKRLNDLDNAKKVAFLEYSSLMTMIEDRSGALREHGVAESDIADVDAFVARVAVTESLKLSIDEFGEMRWTDGGDDFFGVPLP